MKARLLGLICSALTLTVYVHGLCGPYDWPMINGGRERTSWAKHETELAPPFTVQMYNTPSSAEHLTFDNGMLLIGGGNQVYAFDLQNDSMLWSFEIPEAGGSIGCVPAFAGSVVLCGAQQGTGLFCLDRASGLPKWEKPLENLYTRNPIPDGDRVYIVYDSLYCLDIMDGSTIWSFPVSGQKTPAVDDSTVYMAGYALNKFTGEIRWQGEFYGQLFLTLDSSFLYAEKGGNRDIVSLRKSDGQTQWTYHVPDGDLIWLNGGVGAITDTYLCFVVWRTSENKAALYTLDKATGNYLWHRYVDVQGLYPPTIANGIVYVTDWTVNVLRGFNLATGDMVFSDDTHQYYEQPIVADHTLFVNTWSGVKALRKAGTSTETSETAELPASVHLNQNYPNPFNPSTTIHYTLPGEGRPEKGGRLNSHTVLKIYNLLGQEVRTLVDEMQGPGQYTVSWDGKNHFGKGVSSGIYMYRIQAGNVTETREMMLLK